MLCVIEHGTRNNYVMRFKFWKKGVTLSPATKNIDNRMKAKISVNTVRSANERMIREGNRTTNAPIVTNGSFEISIKLRKGTISRSISSEEIKHNYGKALEAVYNGKKL